MWNFDNEFAKNVIIFGVDNNSSSHADNPKNNFLVVSEGPTYGINGSFGSEEKKFSINFSKANTKFCSSLHYNTDNSYLSVNGTEIFKLKLTIKMLTFQLSFFSEIYLDLVLTSITGFSATESWNVSLNG